MTMKELLLNFENTEELEKVIEHNYFTNGYLGRKSDINNLTLSINKTDTIYTILSGISYKKVEIKNEKIVGILTCDIIEDNDLIILKPSNNICVKDNKQNKYTFY